MTTCYLPPILKHSLPGGVGPAVFLPLWERANAGDRDAAGEIVRRVLPMCRLVARRVAKKAGVRSAEDLDDLMSDGLEAILDAIRLYRPERGFAFTTFAYKSALARMRRGLMLRRLVHLPVHILTKSFKVKRDAAAAGVSLEAAVAAIPNPNRRGRVEAVFRSLDAERFTMSYEFEPVYSPGDSAKEAAEEAAARVASVLDQLRPQLAEVVRMRYGIGCEPQSLRQIGERLGVTKQRVDQINQNAMRQLRFLASNPDPNPEDEGAIDPCWS